MGECPTNVEFSASNFGFQGAVRLKPLASSLYALPPNPATGDFYILALCDGNFCEGGDRAHLPGNGRMMLLKKASKITVDGVYYDCQWQAHKVINLPETVNFPDYSSIALLGDRIAVSSQEKSQVWIGRMDLQTLELVDGGKMYNFPRNDMCQIVYCNIEGIDFLNDNMLVAISDQMKSPQTQSFLCASKDESVHIFAIPS